MKHASPRSAAIGRHGSLTRYVGLHNLILQQDEQAGVHSVPCRVITAQITDMDMAGTRLTSQVAVLDAAAWSRNAPCCDQLLSSSQYTRYTDCCIASDAVNGVSHVTYKTVYKGSTYMRVLNFGHFSDCQEGGSTYMLIDLYARTYGKSV